MTPRWWQAYVAEMERLEKRTRQILDQGSLFGAGFSLCVCEDGMSACPEHGHYRNDMTPYLRARFQALAELEGKSKPRRRTKWRVGGEQLKLF